MASSTRQSLYPAKKKTSLEDPNWCSAIYRYEPGRKSNNGDEESDASELALRYNTRITLGRFAQHSDKCSSLFAELRYDTIRHDIFTCAQKLTKWPA